MSPERQISHAVSAGGTIFKFTADVVTPNPLPPMADPLLTTLCTICHILPPKYVCPGCSAATCSLSCSKKHKTWANCSGKRDPAAYMPAHKLRTAAGVDHDYNFLAGIERKVERNHRELVEEKGLFERRDLSGQDDKYNFRKQWFGENVRFLPNADRKGGGGKRNFEDDSGDDDDDGGSGGADEREGRRRASYLTARMRRRLADNDIEVVQMPVGMVRQRENTTSWHRKSLKINWCVEWMFYDAEMTHTRIRHKALETVPLYKAAGKSMAWYRKGQQKEEDEDDDAWEDLHTRKKRRILIREIKDEELRSAMQDAHDAVWVATTYPSQNPLTGAWDLDRSPTVSSWLPDEEIEARRDHQFFLLKPLTPAGKPKELIPIDSTETLATALQRRTVLEYPTVYILPSSTALPENHILGSTERRPKRKRGKNKRKEQPTDKKETTQPAKRRALTKKPKPTQRGGRQPNGKRVAFADQSTAFAQRFAQPDDESADEGEINSDGEARAVVLPHGDAAAADTTSSDPDTSSDEDSSSDSDADDDDDDGPPEEVESKALPPPPPQKKVGMNLVEYSDSDSEDEADGDGEELDLTTMNPDNPELVAGAIKEIVELLS